MEDIIYLFIKAFNKTKCLDTKIFLAKEILLLLHEEREDNFKLKKYRKGVIIYED